MSIKISIVICTYNRSEMLKGCLASLASQTALGESFEVIVIDNNSSDNTEQVVKEFFGNSNIRYITESKVGLSYARNKGLSEAQGEYIAYLDDDVLVPINWVETVILITKRNPFLTGLGGPLYPFYTSSKPTWYEDIYSVQMGRKEKYFLEPRRAFIGANMVWNRKILDSIGGFKPEFGLIGNSLNYIGLGEETDAYHRAWQANPSARFLFVPELGIKHWVPPWKMTLTYRFRRFFFAGYFDYQIYGPHSFFLRISYLNHIVIDLLKTFIKALLSIRKYSHWKKWVYCELNSIAFGLGKVYGGLGFLIRSKNG